MNGILSNHLPSRERQKLHPLRHSAQISGFGLGHFLILYRRRRRRRRNRRKRMHNAEHAREARRGRQWHAAGRWQVSKRSKAAAICRLRRQRTRLAMTRMGTTRYHSHKHRKYITDCKGKFCIDLELEVFRIPNNSSIASDNFG